MSLTFEPIWSLPWVVLALAGLLALVMWTYPQRVRHLPARDRRILIGLRLAAIVLLAVAMLRPVLLVRTGEKQTGFLYFVTDASRSMSTPDGPASLTRRQALLKSLEESRDVIEELAENIEIRYVDFASRLNEVDEPTDNTGGNESDYPAAVTELHRETEGKRVYGVVLLGDGAPRVSAAAGVDPREQTRQAAREFGIQRIPVHTVVYGGSGIGTSVDLAVEDLQVDPNPFQGKVVLVRGNLRAVGAAGRRLTTRVLVEDRSGKRPGEVGEMIEPAPLKTSTPRNDDVGTNENVALIPVELSFVPTQPGEYKIAFEAVPLDGELKTGNNRVESIITVRSGGISVAYFDRIRPEQRLIRNVNAAENIQLDFLPVRFGGIGEPTKIEARWFESGPAAYDVYLIGDVPANVFGPDNLEKLARRVEQDGAGLMMLGGYYSFGPGGYAETPLARLLPVRLRADAEAIASVDRFSEELHYLTPLEMVPTDNGLRHYVMRIDPEGKHQEKWQSLPRLEGANRLLAKGGLVEVLARTPDGSPLLLSHQLAPARVMAFGADSTHQWYQLGFQQEHQRFWRQVILYLARKEEQSENPVWVRVEGRDARDFSVKSAVPLVFGARGADQQPLPDARFEGKVIDPAGREHELTPAKRGEEHTALFRETDIAGDYWVRVAARNDAGFIGSAWTRFLIESKDLELDNPAADPALMEDIARLSGGTSMRPDELKGFLERLAGRELSGEDPLGVKRITLWDAWPRWGEDDEHYLPGLLLLFVLVMTVEWFWRKRKGLV